MKPVLTLADFQRAATVLDCDIPAIRAVTAVEAPRGGFNPDGTPTILFERHVFHRLTNGKYATRAPDLSSASPGGYGTYASQHGRLARAAQFDRDAALMSCSWGMFQCMGFNHAICGHPTLQDFVNAMYESEGKHLDAFVAFVRSQGLADELREHRWADFARRYNGSNYAINRYDDKLAAAYLAASRG